MEIYFIESVFDHPAPTTHKVVAIFKTLTEAKEKLVSLAKDWVYDNAGKNNYVDTLTTGVPTKAKVGYYVTYHDVSSQLRIDALQVTVEGGMWSYSTVEKRGFFHIVKGNENDLPVVFISDYESVTSNYKSVIEDQRKSLSLLEEAEDSLKSLVNKLEEQLSLLREDYVASNTVVDQLIFEEKELLESSRRLEAENSEYLEIIARVEEEERELLQKIKEMGDENEKLRDENEKLSAFENCVIDGQRAEIAELRAEIAKLKSVDSSLTAPKNTTPPNVLVPAIYSYSLEPQYHVPSFLSHCSPSVPCSSSSLSTNWPAPNLASISSTGPSVANTASAKTPSREDSYDNMLAELKKFDKPTDILRSHTAQRSSVPPPPPPPPPSYRPLPLTKPMIDFNPIKSYETRPLINYTNDFDDDSDDDVADASQKEAMEELEEMLRELDGKIEKTRSLF